MDPTAKDSIPSAQTSPERLAGLKHEYERSIDILKQYTTLQFAQLSVFIAINGAAFAFLFGGTPPILSPYGGAGVKALTAIIATLFWVLQESHMYVVAHFFRRSANLEKELGYRGFLALPGMPEYKYSPGRLALRVFYALVTLSWLIEALVSIARVVPSKC